MDLAIGSGQTDTHIEYRQQRDHTGAVRPVGLLPQVWVYFDQLREEAAAEGMDLLIASGFRDFDRQLTIWNSKASGTRPVMSASSEPLDISRLDELQLCHAIMRWSALPGASRHHWGSDMDVYDGAGLAADYSLQLLPQEYQQGGPFHKLDTWLTARINSGAAHGFFRPYQKDLGGIAPEPWHLSCAPAASLIQQEWQAEQLRHCLASVDIALKNTILDNLDDLFQRYIDVEPAG